MYKFKREYPEIHKLEIQLKKKFDIQKVIVVPGDCDHHEFIKQELGRATVQYLKKIVDRNVTIAATRGTTMAAVADAMVPFEKYEGVLVPARGGLGEKVEDQAKTIVAELAKAEKGKTQVPHAAESSSHRL